MFEIHLHLVWVTKYRMPVLVGLVGLDFPTNCERGVKGYPARSYSTGDR